MKNLSMLAILITASVVVTTSVVTVLWDWFVVPMYNLKSLSIPNAVVLAVAANALNYRIEFKDKHRNINDTIWVATGMSLLDLLLSVTLAMFIGWMVRMLSNL